MTINGFYIYLQDMELSDDDVEDGDDEASDKLARQPPGVKKNMRDVLESFYSDLVSL